MKLSIKIICLVLVSWGGLTLCSTFAMAQKSADKTKPRLVLAQNLPIPSDFAEYSVCVVFSLDGKLLATSSFTEQTAVWEVETGRLLYEFPIEPNTEGAQDYSAKSVAFSNDKKWLASAFQGVVKIYDITTGKLKKEFNNLTSIDFEILEVEFSTDQKRLLITKQTKNDGFNELVTVDIASKKIVSRKRRAVQKGKKTEILFAEKKLKSLGGKFKNIDTPEAEVSVIAVAKTAGLAAIGVEVQNVDTQDDENDSEIKILRLSDGKEISRLESSIRFDVPDYLAWSHSIQRQGDFITSRKTIDNQWRVDWDNMSLSRFSPNYKYVVLEASDEEEEKKEKIVEIRESESGNLQRIVSMKSMKYLTAISNDGNSIAFEGDCKEEGDGCIFVQNLIQNTLTAKFPVPYDPSRYPTFSPDNKLIAVSQDSREEKPYILIWDLAKKKEFKRLPNPVNSDGMWAEIMDFSPDGNLLAVAFGEPSSEASVEVWLFDLKKGRALRPFLGHSIAVNEVSFSPDSRFVVTNSGDEARVWNAATGKMRFRIEDPGSNFRFSADNKYIYSNQDLYRVADGAKVCQFFSLANGNIVIIAPDGRFDTNNLEETEGIHWVIPDAPLKSLPLEIFMRQYYEPGLLRRILNGERFKPLPLIADINLIQPKVIIKEIKSVANSDDFVNVAVEVENVSDKNSVSVPEKKQLSSGVFDLRIFRDGQLIGASATMKDLEEYIKAAPKLVEQDRATKTLINTGEDKAWRKANDLANMVKFDKNKATLVFENIRLPHDGRDKIEFSAYAFNADRVKSETARATYEVESPTVNKGKTYIFSIGVNAYENPAYNLQFADDDARKTQEILAARFEADNQKVVKIPLISDYDSKTKQITENNAAKQIIKAVFSLMAGEDKTKIAKEILDKIPNAAQIEKVNPEDTLIISFSGHGYGDPNGIFYLLPTDIGKNTARLSPDVLSNLISSDELSLWMRDVTAKEMIMIIDACHSALAVQGDGFKPGPMGSRGLGQLAYDKGMKILSATQADNIALEIGCLGQGLLSFALLQEGIVFGKADIREPKGKLFTNEWLNYAENRVPGLYDEIKTGKCAEITSGKNEVVYLYGKKIESIQTPKLFNFTKGGSESILINLR